MRLESIVRNLRLPIAVVGLVVAVLTLFGLDAEQIASVAATLVGAQLCVSLIVDVSKWSGIVSDGTAGKWSAAFNAVIFAGVAVQLKFFPAFDVAGLDAQLFEFAKTAGVVFLYIIQVVGTKGFHNLLVRGFGITAFTFNALPPSTSVR